MGLIEKECLNCGKIFKMLPSWKRIYCSISCSNEASWKNSLIRKRRIEGISRTSKGRKSVQKGKTWEEFYGVERAKKMKEKIPKKGHPCWCKGLTKEIDQRIKSSWRKGLTKETDERVRLSGKKLSLKVRGRKNHNFGKLSPHYEGDGQGSRKDLNNQFFRSRWEANFARILNYWNIPWEYETTRFDLGECTYCPDFKIFDSKIGYYFVEVIGFFDDIHKKKIKLFLEKYPQEKLQLITKIEYSDLRNCFSNKIQGWEEWWHKNKTDVS